MTNTVKREISSKIDVTAVCNVYSQKDKICFQL